MNASLKVHLTSEGYQELQGELEKLQEKYPKAVDRVTKAREYGDLSENSEYHAAREDLSFIMGRMNELEDLLARAEVINGVKKNGHVDLGCKVTLHANDKEMTFTIVGEYEADPTKQKISATSPLGKALMGRKPNEQIEYEAPVGKIIYTIKKVH